MSKRLFILTILLSLLATSCFRLERVLKLADSFILYKVTDYFELTSDQKRQLKTDFQSTFNEVKKHDFSVLEKTFSRFADRLEIGNPKVAESRQFYSDIEVVLKRSYARFEPLAQTLVANQAKTNFSRFDQEFLKKYEDGLEKAKNESRQRKEVKKRFMRVVNETVEFLTDEQEDKLDEYIKLNPPPSLQRIESQKHVFEKFKLVRMNEHERIQFIQQFFIDWDSLQLPEYRARRVSSQDLFKNWGFEQLEGMTEKQRKNFIENLRTRALELRQIAEKL